MECREFQLFAKEVEEFACGTRVLQLSVLELYSKCLFALNHNFYDVEANRNLSLMIFI
jgi:hypothetical protein